MWDDFVFSWAENANGEMVHVDSVLYLCISKCKGYEYKHLWCDCCSNFFERIKNADIQDICIEMQMDGVASN